MRKERDRVFVTGGGVVTMVKKSIPSKLRPEHSGDDIVTVELPMATIVNCYMPPMSSPDLPRRLVQPVEHMNEVLTALGVSDKPVISGGDWNAKTASKQAVGYGTERRSEDDAHNGRGTLLLETLGQNEMVIINGAIGVKGSSGGMTSHQRTGSSVVDYVTISASHLDSVETLDVNTEWLGLSDHASLELAVCLDSTTVSRQVASIPAQLALPKPCPPVRARAPIDDVLDRTLASALSHDEAIAHIFGPVLVNTPEVRVWTDGSAGSGCAGAGIWWGIGARANAAIRITGPQTSDRAEICAVAHALAAADPYRNLHIYTDSSYAAGMLGPWAPKHAATGWQSCANEDVIRNIVHLIRLRHAPTVLTWVKSHSGIKGNEEADKWARKGAKKSAELAVDASTLELVDLLPQALLGELPLQIPKVVVEMPPEKLDELRGVHPLNSGTQKSAPEEALTKTQKRRQRLKAAKQRNKQRLLDAAKKGEGELWKNLRELGDPVTERPCLGAYDLLPVFDIRMNSQPNDPVPGEDPLHRRLVLAECSEIYLLCM